MEITNLLAHTTKRTVLRLGREADPLSSNFPLHHEQSLEVVLQAIVEGLLSLNNPKVDEVLAASGILVYEDTYETDRQVVPHDVRKVWPETPVRTTPPKTRKRVSRKEG